MKTMNYKDFTGTVEFNETDGVFYGKVEDIEGLVNFEADTLPELTAAFQEAVDDYLAYCKAAGIEP